MSDNILIQDTLRATFNAALSVYTRMVEQHGVGFFDGGCLSFALAAQSLIPDSQLYHVSRTKQGCDHIALYISQLDAYVDADGLRSKAALITKMREVEKIDVQFCEPATHFTGLVEYEDVVEEIVLKAKATMSTNSQLKMIKKAALKLQ